MPEAGRGHIAVPTWRFPGASQIERRLRAGERAVSFAERALLRLPASPRTRDWMTKVHKETKRIESLRRLSTLYGVYTEVEAIYTDGNVLALHRQLPAELVSRGGFDPAEMDWPHYLQEVHSPSITALLRRGHPAPPLQQAPRPLPEGTRHRGRLRPRGHDRRVQPHRGLPVGPAGRPAEGAWAGELADLARAAPRYLRAERRDRGEFLRAFMRRYEGADGGCACASWWPTGSATRCCGGRCRRRSGGSARTAPPGTAPS